MYDLRLLPGLILTEEVVAIFIGFPAEGIMGEKRLGYLLEIVART